MILDLTQFINTFSTNKSGDPNTDEVYLCFRLMNKDQLAIMHNQLDNFLSEINAQLEDMPLGDKLEEYYGACLYDTTPEYDELEELRSKAQEIFNVIQNVWGEVS